MDTLDESNILDDIERSIEYYLKKLNKYVSIYDKQYVHKLDDNNKKNKFNIDNLDKIDKLRKYFERISDIENNDNDITLLFSILNSRQSENIYQNNVYSNLITTKKTMLLNYFYLFFVKEYNHKLTTNELLIVYKKYNKSKNNKNSFDKMISKYSKLIIFLE